MSLPSTPVRLGVVSFVNTLPLIDGLDGLADVELRQSVPSLLIDQLEAGEVDLALCSSIDYQRSAQDLLIVPAGLLGCEGPTLTVRLYAKCPVEQITRVYCDTDSHTSVTLMRILLQEVYGLEPELVDYDAREHVAENRPIESPEAVLLIGDKVVTDSPAAVAYPTQLDLGQIWHEHTGLPFVFAIWMARRDADLDQVRMAAQVLDRQRRHNLERLDAMITRRAVPRGWPRDLADDYLKRCLIYDWSASRRAALELFFAKAREHGFLARVRPLVLIDEVVAVGV